MATRFTPALRFHRLTPLFDVVAAATARDGTLKRRVLGHAALVDGEAVLDIGCGTGTLAVAAARQASGVSVTGLDADPAILRKARARAAEARLDITFDEGWSNALPYDDASFDVVLSRSSSTTSPTRPSARRPRRWRACSGRAGASSSGTSAARTTR